MSTVQRATLLQCNDWETSQPGGPGVSSEPLSAVPLHPHPPAERPPFWSGPGNECNHLVRIARIDSFSGEPDCVETPIFYRSRTEMCRPWSYSCCRTGAWYPTLYNLRRCTRLRNHKIYQKSRPGHVARAHVWRFKGMKADMHHVVVFLSYPCRCLNSWSFVQTPHLI